MRRLFLLALLVAACGSTPDASEACQKQCLDACARWEVYGDDRDTPDPR